MKTDLEMRGGRPRLRVSPLTHSERAALIEAPLCPICMAARSPREYCTAECYSCHRDTYEDKEPGFYEAPVVRTNSLSDLFPDAGRDGAVNVFIRRVLGDDLKVFNEWSALVKGRGQTQRDALVELMGREVERVNKEADFVRSIEDGSFKVVQ